MTTTSRLTKATSYLLAIVAFAALAPLDANVHRADASRLEARTTAARGPRFVVRGRVRKLYPGANKLLKLRIRNPNRFPIKLRWLRVRVRRSNVRGCARRWARPKRVLRLRFLVPPRSRVLTAFPIRMRKRAPDACQGVRWRLRFRGEAVRRPR